MIKPPEKRLKKQQEQLKRSSRQFKYWIKYHTKKYPVDIEAETIAEAQRDLDIVIEAIVSNHSLTRLKIKQLIYFVTQRKEWVMAELYIDKFLDCLLDQSKRSKNITLDPHVLADSKIHAQSWVLFDKILVKRNQKK